MFAHQFEEKLANLNPVHHWFNFNLLVAVSGGPDSVALLLALQSIHRQLFGSTDAANQFPGKIFVGHINHGIRGAASDEDQQFVQKLATQLGISFETVVLQPDGNESNRGQGLEAKLRSRRYAAFEQLANRVGARIVFTGHNKNDQAETVLFRILRGTGISGLASIPYQRKLNQHVTVTRPLLSMTRLEIESYLRDMNQSFRIDETNTSDQFTRNRLRHDVLPMLDQHFGNDVSESLAGLAELASEQGVLLSKLLAPLLQSHVTVQPNQIVINTKNLTREPLIVRSLIRAAWAETNFPTIDMNHKKWSSLADFILDPHHSPIQLPGNIRVEHDGEQVRLTR